MLQQTQVARVLGPFERFALLFPTATACANSPLADVVVAWAGLGYNRRAVSLHRSAELIVERHQGEVPRDLGSLRALPGVGAYTSRAVLSFAFEQDTGVVDTNVARLLSRAVAGRPLQSAQIQQHLADALVPAGRSWAFNQALFDIGSRHCCSGQPECEGCPLQRRCRWFAGGNVSPDPAVTSAGLSRAQSKFEGSDRQGRGRLVAALRCQGIDAGDLASTAGWVGDTERARRVAGSLVADGLARWTDAGGLELERLSGRTEEFEDPAVDLGRSFEVEEMSGARNDLDG